ASAKWAVEAARQLGSPVALLAKKGVLEKGKKSDSAPSDYGYDVSREQAMECIIESVPKDAIFVATTGRATRELHALRELSGFGHHHDFLNVGAMGHTSSIAAGIALGNKKRMVVCFDGDAAVLMHLGSLTTIGSSGLSNFLHIVLNNGAHESVGGQPTVG